MQYPQSFNCRSENYKPNFCPAQTGGGVKLTYQISTAPCIYGDTWYYDTKGVYVRDGCQATFMALRDEQMEAQKAVDICVARAKSASEAQGARNFEIDTLGKEVSKIGDKGYSVKISVKSNPRGFFQSMRITCFISDGVLVTYRAF